MELTEVRAGINRTVDRLIAPLALRRALVRRAAWHEADDAAVQAPEHEAAVMRRVAEATRREEPCPGVVDTRVEP